MVPEFEKRLELPSLLLVKGLSWINLGHNGNIHLDVDFIKDFPFFSLLVLQILYITAASIPKIFASMPSISRLLTTALAVFSGVADAYVNK